MTEEQIEQLADIIDASARMIAPAANLSDLARVYALLLQQARESVEIAGRVEDAIDYADVPF